MYNGWLHTDRKGIIKLTDSIYYYEAIAIKPSEWRFFHKCEKEDPLAREISSATGICYRCKKYIISYNKLEVMIELKELTG